MGKVMIFDHPLIQHKVSLMRDKNTASKEFRDLAREVAMLMTYEITRDLPTKEVEIETPICPARVPILAGKKLIVCRSVQKRNFLGANTGNRIGII